MASILYRLTRVFRETLDLANLTISPTTSPENLDAWDSVAHVELCLAIESEFGVRLTAEELASLLRVGNMLDLLQERGIPEEG